MKKVLSSEMMWKEGGGYYSEKPEDLLLKPMLPDLRRVQDIRLFELFKRYGQLSSSSQVLEIGCGKSEWLPFLASRFGCQIWGLDIEKYAVELARANLAGAGVKGEIDCRDAFDTSTSGDLHGKFDLIYSMGLMEHFDDAAERLATLANYLKPNGRIITFVPNLQGINWGLQRLASLERLNMHVIYDVKKLTEIHSSAGFEIVAAGYAGFYDGFISGGDVKTPPLLNKVHQRLCRATNMASVGLTRLIGESLAPELGWFSPHVYCAARMVA